VCVRRATCRASVEVLGTRPAHVQMFTPRHRVCRFAHAHDAICGVFLCAIARVRSGSRKAASGAYRARPKVVVLARRALPITGSRSARGSGCSRYSIFGVRRLRCVALATHAARGKHQTLALWARPIASLLCHWIEKRHLAVAAHTGAARCKYNHSTTATRTIATRSEGRHWKTNVTRRRCKSLPRRARPCRDGALRTGSACALQRSRRSCRRRVHARAIPCRVRCTAACNALCLYRGQLAAR
jgi:hypothetical protein